MATRTRIGLIGLLAVWALPGQSRADPTVWYWFATCGGPAMTLEIHLDKTTLYKATFPICKAGRKSEASQGQTGRVEFAFTPKRALLWEGYRERSDLSVPNQPLEVNLWQAGAEPDSLVIGVSVADRDKVLMNTVHIAPAARRGETTIAKGLMIETYVSEPMRRVGPPYTRLHPSAAVRERH